MKKPLLLLTVLMSLSAQAVESQYPCKEIIFKGQSKDHVKEVMACKTKTGFISYTEGDIAEKKPDVDILIPVKQASWDSIYKEDISLYALNFTHAKEKYSLILGYERNASGAIAGVYITPENGKGQNKGLQLDPETVEENIVASLSDYGIEQYTK